jgi:hypothetical protein
VTGLIPGLSDIIPDGQRLSVTFQATEPGIYGGAV